MSQTLELAVTHSPTTISQQSSAQDLKRINILFMIDQLCTPGGAERVLLKTIARLPKDRFQCRLVTFKYDPSVEAFANLPCPLHVFPVRRTYSPGGWRTAIRLLSLIRQWQIDIVHTFHETSDLWGGMIAKASFRPVLISSRRDMGFLRSGKHDLAYRIVNRLVDHVLCVSEKMRQQCIEREGIAAERVTTIYNGVDLPALIRPSTRMATRRSLNIDDRAPVIVTVGNIRRIKGIDVLLRAAALVREQFPEAVFLVVGGSMEGEADYLEEIRRLTTELDLEDNVRFLGSREDVTSILQASDVFCLPSRSEGFSNALIEAMACGLPCVATDVGGNAEALENGKSGSIVSSEDFNSIAACIRNLLTSPALRTSAAELAKYKVEHHFSTQLSVRKLIAVYEATLDPSRDGSGMIPR